MYRMSHDIVIGGAAEGKNHSERQGCRRKNHYRRGGERRRRPGDADAARRQHAGDTAKPRRRHAGNKVIYWLQRLVPKLAAARMSPLHGGRGERKRPSGEGRQILCAGGRDNLLEIGRSAAGVDRQEDCRPLRRDCPSGKPGHWSTNMIEKSSP